MRRAPRARRGPPSDRVAVRGPPPAPALGGPGIRGRAVAGRLGRGASARLRPSSSSWVGASSANPCETSVRQRSTGSPPGARRGRSTVVIPRPAARGTPGPCSSCRRSTSSTTCRCGSSIRRRTRSRRSGRGTRELVPRAVQLGQERGPEQPADRSANAGRVDVDRLVRLAAEADPDAGLLRGAVQERARRRGRVARPCSRAPWRAGRHGPGGPTPGPDRSGGRSAVSIRPVVVSHQPTLSGLGGNDSVSPGSWSCREREGPDELEVARRLVGVVLLVDRLGESHRHGHESIPSKPTSMVDRLHRNQLACYVVTELSPEHRTRGVTEMRQHPADGVDRRFERGLSAAGAAGLLAIASSVRPVSPSRSWSSRCWSWRSSARRRGRLGGDRSDPAPRRAPTTVPEDRWGAWRKVDPDPEYFRDGRRRRRAA